MCQFPGKPDAIDQFSDRLKERGWTDPQIVKMADRLKTRAEARARNDREREAWSKVIRGEEPYSW